MGFGSFLFWGLGREERAGIVAIPVELMIFLLYNQLEAWNDVVDRGGFGTYSLQCEIFRIHWRR